MISRIRSAAICGLDVVPVDVEAGFSRGIPGMTIVGLPDNAVRESRERIRFAIRNSGFEFPGGTKIVVNLSPADLRKEGSGFDLPVAAAVLTNHYHIQPGKRMTDFLFYGELDLDGHIKPVRGALNLAVFARDQGYRGVILPAENGPEAANVDGIEVYGFSDLRTVIAFLSGDGAFLPEVPGPVRTRRKDSIDFRHIRGQYTAKRVLEIAAAGFHNVLMVGPPGSGKSLLTKALPSILPEMTREEVLQTSLVYSASGMLDRRTGLMSERPFRSPHHTISDVGISGGGKIPIPGEISLAHNGVLFLDELPHFRRSALEVLRQPMEEGRITISRALTSSTFPARFMLIAAMNTWEDAFGPAGTTRAGASRRQYYGRISRPLLDRIDLQIKVPRVPIEYITSSRSGETSRCIRARVSRAREIQLRRFHSIQRDSLFANSQMSNPEIRRFCPLTPQGKKILTDAMELYQLSARAYFRILKVGRTIADLAGVTDITKTHIQEALQYRSRKLFES